MIEGIKAHMFSGMPNPEWEPTESEAKEITAKLQNLEPINTEPRRGLDGFTIKYEDGSYVDVHDGRVHINDGRVHSIWMDTNNLEILLFNQALGHIGGDLAAALKKNYEAKHGRKGRL